MRRLLLGLTLLSFILLGCEGVNDSVDQPHNPEEICDSHYVIPVAEAIDNLKTFFRVYRRTNDKMFWFEF